MPGDPERETGKLFERKEAFHYGSSGEGFDGVWANALGVKF